MGLGSHNRTLEFAPRGLRQRAASGLRRQSVPACVSLLWACLDLLWGAQTLIRNGPDFGSQVKFGESSAGLGVAGACCPGQAGCALRLVRRSLGEGGSFGEGGEEAPDGRAGAVRKGCGDARWGDWFWYAGTGAGAPRLHRSDGCAVWGLEPFEGFALFVAILRKAEMGLGSPAARKCEA